MDRRATGWYRKVQALIDKGSTTHSPLLLDYPAETWVEIDRGGEGVVELEPSSMIIRKRYEKRSAGKMAELARREYDYLRRFSAAVSGKPYVSCPQPISVSSDQGMVQMSYCSGTRLDRALMDRSISSVEDLEHVAEQIMTGLTAYVQEFDEPFHTIRTHNMLYDPETKVLSFVDLYGVNRFPDRGIEHASFEISLARLIGGAIFRSVRPKTSINTAYWTGHKHLLETVMARVRAHHDASPSVIQRASLNLFTHAYQNWQPRSYTSLRHIWYRTFGKALFLRRSREVITE